MDERNDEMMEVVTDAEVSTENNGVSSGTVAVVAAACVAIGAAGSWIAKKAKRLYDMHKAKKETKEKVVDAKPGDYREVDSESSEDDKNDAK